VIGNTVTAPDGTSAQGGGIFNNARTATLDRSTLTGHRAVGQSAEGGGIFQAGGMVTLISGPVRGNKPDNCFPPASVPTRP
jgi:hypothetical protein